MYCTRECQQAAWQATSASTISHRALCSALASVTAARISTDTGSTCAMIGGLADLDTDRDAQAAFEELLKQHRVMLQPLQWAPLLDIRSHEQDTDQRIGMLWNFLPHKHRLRYANFLAFRAERLAALKRDWPRVANPRAPFAAVRQLWMLLTDEEREHYRISAKLAHTRPKRPTGSPASRDEKEPVTKRAKIDAAKEVALRAGPGNTLNLLPEIWQVIINALGTEDIRNLLALASVNVDLYHEVWQYLFIIDVRTPLKAYWSVKKVKEGEETKSVPIDWGYPEGKKLPYALLVDKENAATPSTEHAYSVVMRSLAAYMARSAMRCSFASAHPRKLGRFVEHEFELEFGITVLDLSALCGRKDGLLKGRPFLTKAKTEALPSEREMALALHALPAQVIDALYDLVSRVKEHATPATRSGIGSALENLIFSVLMHGFPDAVLRVTARPPPFSGVDERVTGFTIGMTTCEVEERPRIAWQDEDGFARSYAKPEPVPSEAVDWLTHADATFGDPIGPKYQLPYHIK